jgi:hypothetical protein
MMRIVNFQLTSIFIQKKYITGIHSQLQVLAVAYRYILLW